MWWVSFHKHYTLYCFWYIFNVSYVNPDEIGRGYNNRLPRWSRKPKQTSSQITKHDGFFSFSSLQFNKKRNNNEECPNLVAAIAPSPCVWYIVRIVWKCVTLNLTIKIIFSLNTIESRAIFPLANVIGWVCVCVWRAREPREWNQLIELFTFYTIAVSFGAEMCVLSRSPFCIINFSKSETTWFAVRSFAQTTISCDSNCAYVWWPVSISFII